MKKAKKSVYEIVTETLLKKIEEEGLLPWQKPWKVTGNTQIRSYHGHTYRGINLLLALFTTKKGPWITWNQVKKLGGKVKKGEEKEYEIVTFYKLREWDQVKDDGSTETRKCPMMRYYRVYSLEQTEGVPVPAWLEKERSKAKQRPTVSPLEAGQKVWDNYKDKPTLEHGGSRACYIPSRDQINMPEMQTFNDSEEYYSTLFHEAVHSTGHPTRLHREMNGLTFVSEHTYSKEELVAELGASFLMAETGIEKKATVENSAAYLKHWLTKLDSDPKILIQASSQAQKAVDHIKGIKWDDKDKD